MNYNPMSSAGDFDHLAMFRQEIDQENMETSYTGCDVFSCFSAGHLELFDASSQDPSEF